MSTFITRLDTAGPGPRLAVKDLIDVKGVTTTAGSRAVERRAAPATSDAACLAGARAADARIVGKTNLHELGRNRPGPRRPRRERHYQRPARNPAPVPLPRPGRDLHRRRPEPGRQLHLQQPATLHQSLPTERPARLTAFTRPYSWHT
jgi:hypothetical protein